MHLGYYSRLMLYTYFLGRGYTSCVCIHAYEHVIQFPRNVWQIYAICLLCMCKYLSSLLFCVKCSVSFCAHEIIFMHARCIKMHKMHENARKCTKMHKNARNSFHADNFIFSRNFTFSCHVKWGWDSVISNLSDLQSYYSIS